MGGKCGVTLEQRVDAILELCIGMAPEWEQALSEMLGLISEFFVTKWKHRELQSTVDQLRTERDNLIKILGFLEREALKEKKTKKDILWLIQKARIGEVSIAGGRGGGWSVL